MPEAARMTRTLPSPKDRIIVALDVDRLEDARALIKSLAPHVGCFKIGLELMTAVGAPQAVRLVHELGGRVFLDGKFDDIPNTVAGASKSAAGLGVYMFNVHACAGPEAMAAAAKNKGGAIALAVTVLTSISDEGSRAIFGAPSRDKVLQFAREAARAGLDGIVCSPQELPFLASDPDLAALWKVTPGVRPEWAATGDQRRVMTPAEAVRAGATALVVGRPITAAPSSIGGPVDAAKKIAEEIASVL